MLAGGIDVQGLTEALVAIANDYFSLALIDDRDGQAIGVSAPGRGDLVNARRDQLVTQSVEALPWTLMLTRNQDVSFGFSDVMTNRGWGFVGVSVLVTALTCIWITRRLLLPLRRLRAVAMSFAAGRYGQRANMHSRDEIGDLATAFDFMAAAIAERTAFLKEQALTPYPWGEDATRRSQRTA